MLGPMFKQTLCTMGPNAVNIGQCWANVWPTHRFTGGGATTSDNTRWIKTNAWPIHRLITIHRGADLCQYAIGPRSAATLANIGLTGHNIGPMSWFLKKYACEVMPALANLRSWRPMMAALANVGPMFGGVRPVVQHWPTFPPPLATLGRTLANVRIANVDQCWTQCLATFLLKASLATIMEGYNMYA